MTRPLRQGRLGHGSIMYRPHLKEVRVERRLDLRWALIAVCMAGIGAALLWALWW
jgi:hypothetical protein